MNKMTDKVTDLKQYVREYRAILIFESKTSDYIQNISHGPYKFT